MGQKLITSKRGSMGVVESRIQGIFDNYPLSNIGSTGRAPGKIRAPSAVSYR